MLAHTIVSKLINVYNAYFLTIFLNQIPFYGPNGTFKAVLSKKGSYLRSELILNNTKNDSELDLCGLLRED